MNRLVLLIAVCFGLGLLTVSSVAQSTHDLAPPMQADLKSQQVIMSPDPAALPTYQFAVASLTEDGKIEVLTRRVVQILLAKPESMSQKAPDGHTFYTERVRQNYTVMVPTQKEDDEGKKYTVLVPQTQTRMVPVRRTRKMTAEERAEAKKKKAVEGKKVEESSEIPAATIHQVESEYEVQVPYTETDKDGNSVQKTRTEKRLRMIAVMRGKTRTQPVQSKDVYAMDGLQVFDVNGEQLKEADIKKRLTERRPVIIVPSRDSIGPYFVELFRPGTVFLVPARK